MFPDPHEGRVEALRPGVQGPYHLRGWRRYDVQLTKCYKTLNSDDVKKGDKKLGWKIDEREPLK